MGGSNSTPTTSYSYTDNSSQINQSLTQIRSQINELNSDLDKFKVSIDTHVDTVQQKFIHFDHKVLQIQNEFQESFNFVNHGITMFYTDFIKSATVIHNYIKYLNLYNSYIL